MMQSLVFFGIIIVALMMGKQQASKLKNEAEVMLIAEIQRRDQTMTQLNAAKVQNAELAVRDVEVQQFLNAWKPFLAARESNEIIRMIDRMAARSGAVSLAPTVGRSEDVLIGSATIPTAAYRFMIVSDTVFPLHDTIHTIQTEFPIARVNNLTIARESENIQMRIGLDVPNLEALR